MKYASKKFLAPLSLFNHSPLVAHVLVWLEPTSTYQTIDVMFHMQPMQLNDVKEFL